MRLRDQVEKLKAENEELESKVHELNGIIEHQDDEILSFADHIKKLEGKLESQELDIEYVTEGPFRLALEDAFLAAHTGNTPLAIKHIRSIFEGLDLILPMVQLEEIKRTGGF